jgi:hypothetical protein
MSKVQIVYLFIHLSFIIMNIKRESKEKQFTENRSEITWKKPKNKHI